MIEKGDGRMVLCSRCKKRPAVVFITSQQGDKKRSEGLCMVCAKELNVPQISEYMKHMGVTDEELEQISDQMMELMDGDSFEMGGSGTMPPFIQNIMKNMPMGEEEQPLDMPKTEQHSKKEKRMKKKKELKFLNNYCTNLSQRAEEGKMDVIIGRDKEIERVVQILCRRTKNNPCLIGEPGVGKTAIAEGIAQRIAAGQVPFYLKEKQIYLLDLTSLVAGTQFRGQFESRIKGLLTEVKQEGNIILFIDEMHNLVGAGNSEGSMNAANIMKPALSRGEIQVIGATTFEEYRKYIEKDAALERRFQPITVKEPTVEESIEVLNGIKKYYEKHHRVHISDAMIRLCAKLAERYITDRFLPDKAIDLLDESCACTCLRSPEIAAYDAEQSKLAQMEAQEKQMEEETEVDYEGLAKLKGDMIRSRDRLAELQKKADQVQVTEADLAKVIALWTGIPASKIQETEYAKLAALEGHLKARVVGQEQAVSALAKAIKRTRVQLSAKRRPASFIFVGPTGVGKTALAKALSYEMFGKEDSIIRIDMSEYMESNSTAKLIGAPPGYVGYDEAGQLTDKVKRHPYSIILLDEIEKAHPDVFNILLQILDDGRLTDSQGNTVSFENTIIIMTSNAGSNLNNNSIGFSKSEIDQYKIEERLKEVFRPEFLNRVDEIVSFHSLTNEQLFQIVDLMLKDTSSALANKDITITLSQDAKDFLLKKGTNLKFGARPLRRAIQRYIEDEIAEKILKGEIKNGDQIHITKDGDTLAF